MKKQELQTLLQKYFDAETSVQEEQILKAYFAKEDIDPELDFYSKFFLEMAADGSADDDTLSAGIMEHILQAESAGTRQYRRLWLAVTGIAASLLITFGGLLYYQQRQPFTDTFSNPELAQAYALEVLQYVSSEYNRGVSAMEPVRKVGHATRPLEGSMDLIHRGLAPIKNLNLPEVKK